MREFCGIRSWQNDTRYRDGVMVLWCHLHLIWLVFEGSIPTCACFHANFFVTCSCSMLFFFLFLFLVLSLGMVKEKRGGRLRGGQGKDAWSVKYESIDLCCSQGTKSHHKFKCFQVKL